MTTDSQAGMHQDTRATGGGDEAAPPVDAAAVGSGAGRDRGADAFAALMAFQRESEALGQIGGRLGWDQETVMPRGAAAQRAEEMAAMEGVLHARRTDPRIGDWLAAIDPARLDEVGRAQLRLIRRSWRRAVRVPADLAAEIARTTSLAQGQWAQARAADDFAAFAPVLSRVVALKREEASAIADGRSLYDALLDDFEPGMTAARLERIFGRMRPRLVALRTRIMERAEAPRLRGRFAADEQLRLAETLARRFGYDFSRGRLDLAVHPFSSGSGDDVRITTRTAEDDPFNCLYSTIHETGHAIYEQNIAPEYRLTPLGRGVSMGVHESQSRICENQLGRSAAFTGWLFGRMRDAFGDFGIDTAGDFHRAVNAVRRGYIRTEADELQYNLHIFMRFDLERALIGGDLAPEDLEDAWNARFEADFGYPVDRPSNGCLQDVHWSVGLFGYFPTYALGNVYAGALHAAMRADLPDLDRHLAEGDPAPATHWLRERLQRHGGLREPEATIAHAIGAKPGEAPGPEPLLDYLEAKFGALYGLD